LQLAAAVHLERSRVPDVVKKSQEKAGFSPEASAIPEEVKEKSEVEKELLSELPEAPPTSEGTVWNETADRPETGVTPGAEVPVAGEAAATYASAAASKLPKSVQHSFNDINTKSRVDTAVGATANDTPVARGSLTESEWSWETANEKAE
jgi:hypothetical protein